MISGIETILLRALVLMGYSAEDVMAGLTVMLPSPFKSDEMEQARINMLNAQAAERQVKNKMITRAHARREYLDMTEDESKEEEEGILAEIERLGDPAASGRALMFENSIEEDMVILESLYKMRRKGANDGDGNRPHRSADIPFRA